MKKPIKLSIDFYIIILIWLYAFITFNFFHPLKPKYIQIKNKKAIDDIYEIMKNENEAQKDTDLHSLHRWNEDINNNLQKKIDLVNNEILKELDGEFKYVPSMTELYWSSKANNNSDNQFVSTHMDGPFYYCNLYRVLVTINGNKNINTVFPNDGLDINLKKYDMSFFDYNKTPHYIYVNENETDNSQRIILKLHYVKAPFKNHCANVHSRYGRQTRDLFERNKKNLYTDGFLANTGLYYYTFRNYVLIALMMSLIYVIFYNRKSYLIYLLYLFGCIETMLVLYTLHFNFITYKGCP